MHHSWYIIWPQGVESSPFSTHWLNYGRFAVDVFLVLSGYCLMLPVVQGGGLLRGGTMVFLQKRARRILPPYYFTLAFSVLLNYTLIDPHTGGFWAGIPALGWRSIVNHLLLLQDFSATELHKINNVLWSISLEWWIYFLFPPLVWAWRKLGVAATVLLSAVFTFLLCLVCGRLFRDNFSLYYIALFVLGMLGCEIAHTHQAAIRAFRDRLRWDFLTGGAALLTGIAMTGKIHHFSSGNLVDLLVGLVAACLLVTISLRPSGLIGRTLSRKPMLFIGSFSYSIYLIHVPLLQVFHKHILSPLHLTALPGFFALELLGIPLVVAIAYLFHLAFERPFMSKPGTRIKTEAQAEIAAVVSPAP